MAQANQYKICSSKTIKSSAVFKTSVLLVIKKKKKQLLGSNFDRHLVHRQQMHTVYYIHQKKKNAVISSTSH